ATPLAMDPYYGPVRLGLKVKNRKITNLWTVNVYKGYVESAASANTWTAGHIDVLPPAEMRATVTDTLRAQLQVCIDETGTMKVLLVSGSDPKVYNATYNAHVRAIAAKTWKLAPLTYKGATAATCFWTEHSYPKETSLDDMTKRIVKGNPNIPWDAETAAANPERTSLSTTIAVRVCIDGAGRVTRVLPSASFRSYPSWSRIVESEVQTWTFTPFVVDGEAWPMCGEVLITAPASAR
ncbi:MAG TPA: hypothetical protein VK427_11590, partial [Kofleriaceae bacterium]|nr:hypothetical protein [Kofleriaceae bacterium]